MKRVLLLACLAAVLSGCSGKVIFVSPKGDDSGSGSRLRPLASLQAACDIAAKKGSAGKSEPVEIRLAEGVYRMKSPVTLHREHSNLVIKGCGTGRTIISGGVELPAFKQDGDRLWTVDLGSLMPSSGEIQQLFVNGVRATRARTPNGGRCYITGKVQETIIDSAGAYAVQKIKIPGEALEMLKGVSAKNPEQLKIEVYHAWDMTRRYIESFNEADSTVLVKGEKMRPWNPMGKVSQFRLTDDISFLDEPGEWFYDAARAQLWYYPLPGEEIGSSRAVIPSARQLVVIKGEEGAPVSDIRFEGITFQETRFTMSRRGDSPQQGAWTTDAVIMADFAGGIVIDNCEVTHTGNNGVWFREGCIDCELTNSYLHDLGIGAVKLGSPVLPKNEETQLTRGIRVENNILRDGGHEFPQGEGVLMFHSSDDVITHNEIADFYYTGISVGWIWGYNHSPSKRNEISFNHIHHLGWGLLSDMGGVYTLGMSEGTKVTDNVIHDIHSLGYGGWGLYTDEGSTGIVLENNLVYNCKCSSFHQHYGKENIIRNNILVNGLHAQLEATRVEKHLSYTFCSNIISYRTGNMYGISWEKPHADVKDNLYWNENGEVSFNGLTLEQWKDKFGKDQGSIIADPKFANVDAADFTIGNTEAIQKIGFKPFDYSRAGVYGDDAWTELASYSPERAEQFRQTVKYYEENVPIMW